MLRAFLFILTLTIVADAAHAITVPDIIERVRTHLWPPKAQPVPIPIPVAKPSPTRSIEHRKVHRPAPKVAKRKWEPIPGVRPIPPIAKQEKRRERPKVLQTKQKRGPTAKQCADLGAGINKYGMTIVRAGARVRGHSDEDFDWARQRCGL